MDRGDEMRRRALRATKRMPSGGACSVGLCYDVRLWAVQNWCARGRSVWKRPTTESSLLLWQTVDSLGLRHDNRCEGVVAGSVHRATRSAPFARPARKGSYFVRRNL